MVETQKEKEPNKPKNPRKNEKPPTQYFIIFSPLEVYRLSNLKHVLTAWLKHIT